MCIEKQFYIKVISFLKKKQDSIVTILYVLNYLAYSHVSKKHHSMLHQVHHVLHHVVVFAELHTKLNDLDRYI